MLYGDHLPSLDIQKEDLIDSNLYQTQYVVWDNLGLAGMKQNLASYQLYSEVLERIGICEGNITKYHQNAYWRTKSYYEDLKVLEYDMLYGENYAYNGQKPYEPTDLVMGTKPVKITDVSRNERGYLLTGENLTPYAHVLFDGSELSAEWIDEKHIQILDEVEYEPEEEPEVSPEASPAASPEASPDAEGKEEKKEDIPNAFLIQIRTDGGTTLGESEVLLWKDTSLGAVKN